MNEDVTIGTKKWAVRFSRRDRVYCELSERFGNGDTGECFAMGFGDDAAEALLNATEALRGKLKGVEE